MKIIANISEKLSHFIIYLIIGNEYKKVIKMMAPWLAQGKLKYLPKPCYRWLVLLVTA